MQGPALMREMTVMRSRSLQTSTKLFPRIAMGIDRNSTPKTIAKMLTIAQGLAEIARNVIKKNF
jgi:hypothetical protein